jgi:hypothetical protein
VPALWASSTRHSNPELMLGASHWRREAPPLELFSHDLRDASFLRSLDVNKKANGPSTSFSLRAYIAREGARDAAKCHLRPFYIWE